ncbi:MAG TPA: sigma-70 family RNA polymerase sigma factor [Coleofasciculaceae cyanobacterium]
MSDLDVQLRQLVKEACSHPPGHLVRQRKLTQVIRLSAGKLWRDSSPHYQDALQQTWVYFCQNVCEAKTGDRYDPDRSSVSTWLNSYLRRRLQDFFIDTQKQQATRVTGLPRSSRSGEVGDITDPIDHLPAEPDVPPILQEVKTWAETDALGELSKIHIEGHPTVTCQLLILRRLPPETGWKELSAELGLSVSTLSSFYQRRCLPLLRKFGESEGYL